MCASRAHHLVRCTYQSDSGRIGFTYYTNLSHAEVKPEKEYHRLQLILLFAQNITEAMYTTKLCMK